MSMVESREAACCPACGTTLSAEQRSAGLCPACLLEMALGSPSLLLELEEADDESETLAFPEDTLAPGRVLGGRYRVRSLLGRGGMGEVWRAWDLKLRVDLALKALRPDLVSDPRALETLRREVRTAREVISPHVCRVFDLVELEGLELLSMEYIDGVTLLDILRGRAPLELAEARELATQFLAGLEAIHGAGLVHRDVKPENIMMTRSGRVVLMDLGIARSLREGGSGTISGTPAYMAPEQARGEAVTPRADVFSAGVVLAEMIAADGLRTIEARQTIWRALQHEPPEVPDSPWAPVIRTAVCRIAGDRYGSAAALARALEEVTLRVAGAEDIKPYPGLASFTEEDAEYFFGRELEVEAIWKKLQRGHLMALIGPSGAGKSSFLRAGLLPVTPTGWRVVVAHPGDRPWTALAQVLAREVSGDADAVRDLVRFAEPDVAVSVVSGWRRRHAEALIVVDQFEELFTQNPPEVQKTFSDLLARLALEADVHVLLSMRDDFLFHCSTQEALAPIFSELTPLKPLFGAALRRALVQPALKCGYRFEDEALVDEMVAEVEGERGALPLLAFAASRLWDYRDREEGVLTREAYEHIGGVGGALAQHAEATLEAIGRDREPMVREIFRNLVTAQGTRVARDRMDLVSVFEEDGRSRAEEILDALIDARLLTSFEVVGGESDDEHHHLEIIHESLLSNWPRLVRWQSQDMEGALLRDQLRQAAQMWNERDRPEDLLWTGTSFKEYELWRERYAGGLSTAEEEFASAMKSKAERRRRQRRLVIATAFGLLLAVLAVVGYSWRQSEAARNRAEASKLLALARIEMEGNPTAAMAYATKSLELADTEEARRFIVELMWRGPVARVLEAPAWLSAFSPDGERLAMQGSQRLSWISADGGEPIEISDDIGYESEACCAGRLSFSEGGDVLLRHLLLLSKDPVTSLVDRFSLPDGGLLERLEWTGEVDAEFRGAGLVTFAPATPETTMAIHGLERFAVDWRPQPPFSEGQSEPFRLGSIEVVKPLWQRPFDVDALAHRVVWARGREVFLQESGSDRGRRSLATTETEVSWLTLSPDGRRLAVLESSGRLSVRGLETGEVTELFGGEHPETTSDPLFSRDGHLLAMFSRGERQSYVWDLRVPVDGKPLVLPMKSRDLFLPAFHPEGKWLAASHIYEGSVSFWPLEWRRARILRPQEEYTWLAGLEFSPDSRWLGTCAGWTPPHLWPLAAGLGPDRALEGPSCEGLTFDPGGEHILTGSLDLPVAVHSMAGGEPRILAEQVPGEVMGVAFGPRGETAAAVAGNSRGDTQLLHVWNLGTGESRALDLRQDCEMPEEGCAQTWLGFGPDGSLYSGGTRGIRRWDVAAGRGEWIYRLDGHVNDMRLSRNGRYLTAVVDSEGRRELMRFDLTDGSRQTLAGWGSHICCSATDATGEILAVADRRENVVRVGKVGGTQRHLLVGRAQSVRWLDVSPDGRWVATADSSEIRLWPMPDLSKPPIHSLPREELLAKLHSFTNLRAVANAESATGWSLEVGPFPGWREVPDW